MITNNRQIRLVKVVKYENGRNRQCECGCQSFLNKEGINNKYICSDCGNIYRKYKDGSFKKLKR